MEYIYDAPYSDVFRCDGEVDFHDYYYISPFQFNEDSYLYCVNRTGIEQSLPKLLEVERGASAKCCEIFCILSGRGFLEYRGEVYDLRRNQMVLLASHEPHRYWNDAGEPMGKVWLEFYGGDSDRIIRHLLDLHGPIIGGPLFPDVCAQVCLLQQRLMVNPYYQASLEIYQILLAMLCSGETVCPTRLTEDSQMNFLLVEAYINAHMSRKITNEELAGVCGVSRQHFIKQFKEHYQQTPQKYIMDQRIQKARHSLLRTGLSVDSIAESLGFCNTSHFIRRFSSAMGISPMKYRKSQRMDADLWNKRF